MADEAIEVNRPDWPLQCRLELPVVPAAVPEARSHTRRMLAKWGLEELADPAELVVCELISNAIQVASVPVGLWLASDRCRILIQVRDDCPAPPVPARPAPDAETGRGLLLVDYLSAAWGTAARPDGAGKTVWAVIGPATATGTPPP